jgi:hypothetical protein
VSAINVSRFASPFATREYIFPGDCRCPGAPHEHDTASVLLRVGASAKARIGRAELEGAVQHDPLAAHRQVVLEGVSAWNLLWPDPAAEDPEQAEAVAVPINSGTVELLDDDLVPLATFIDDLWNEGKGPNSSGARSRVSRRASASRTRTTTRTRGT